MQTKVILKVTFRGLSSCASFRLNVIWTQHIKSRMITFELALPLEI